MTAAHGGPTATNTRDDLSTLRIGSVEWRVIYPGRARTALPPVLVDATITGALEVYLAAGATTPGNVGRDVHDAARLTGTVSRADYRVRHVGRTGRSFTSEQRTPARPLTPDWVGALPARGLTVREPTRVRVGSVDP